MKPSKPKDDKGKTIEKQVPKVSMQEKTSSIKCFKCLGRGNITSQCPTTKTMTMRGQDIYSSQDKATTSPSSSESEKFRVRVRKLTVSARTGQIQLYIYKKQCQFL